MVRNVIVTFENSGDVDADIIPEITVRGSSLQVSHIIVPAATFSGDPLAMTPGSNTATFLDVALLRGHNNICASFSLSIP